MLTIYGRGRSRDCAGQTRRDFLQVGALGLGGLSLPWLLSQQAAASGGSGYLRDKSVVFLFLSGGPSQLETWDPKMQAPVELRTMLGETKTALPGVTFGSTFPKLAARADRLAVVRSFAHGSSSHTNGTDLVLRGGLPDEMSMGSLFARLRGANHQQTGMPTFAQMSDQALETAYTNCRNRVRHGNAPGKLGSAFAAFDPAGDGRLKESMELQLPADRFSDRRSLLSALDQASRKVERSAAAEPVDAYRQQAYDLILGSARDAFDLTKEDPRVVARYSTSKYLIGHKERHASPLGEHLLLARRLCEAGAGFVSINSPSWDMHEGGNNPGIIKGITNLGPPLDDALSVFLDDLAERGLSEKVLLVVSGEMGRTPRINKKGGRDHWGNLCTLLLAGGGLNMGQVIGQSDKSAGAPVQDPVGLNHLLGTVMHTLFDVGQLRVERSAPRDLVQLVERSTPIPQLG